jgi:FixJ family two-component response regulator
MKSLPTVFVIDDDPSVRHSIARMLRLHHLPVETFASGREFLAQVSADRPGCLVCDIQLPDIDGMQLQRHLSATGAARPTVFITGHGDIPLSVRAMKQGASDFLTKPFTSEELLPAVTLALASDERQRAADHGGEILRQRLATLSAREREVLELVVQGLSNRDIGARLALSEHTIKIHRRHVMEKMTAASLAELVGQATRLGISTA